jgi:hypothetical protein
MEGAMSEFTKGPWNKDKRKESLVGSDGKRVVVYGSGLSFAGLPDTESVANSHLIAAAPEMYEFIKRQHNEVVCICRLNNLAESFGAGIECTACTMEAIIAKAEGRAQ